MQTCYGPFFEKKDRTSWFRSDIPVRNWESCKKTFLIIKVEFAINWNIKADIVVDDDDDDDDIDLIRVFVWQPNSQ